MSTVKVSSEQSTSLTVTSRQNTDALKPQKNQKEKTKVHLGMVDAALNAVGDARCVDIADVDGCIHEDCGAAYMDDVPPCPMPDP